MQYFTASASEWRWQMVPNQEPMSPWWSEERLRKALIEHDGNKTAVAREWETSYETIKRWTERHGLEHLAWNSEDGLYPGRNRQVA